MKPRGCRVRAGLWIVLATVLVTGCRVDAESDTGILVNVTFHETIPADGATTIIDTLRFYVAVQHPQEDVFILNNSASGIVVDVTDRNLFVDPYQLLVARAGVQMRRIRVVVVGEKNGVGVLFGQLTDPAAQAFEEGSIVQRTIVLRPADSSFDMSWTVSGCLTSSSPRDPSYEPFTFGSLTDKDCDGWEVPEDCDDTNPLVNPGVEEGYDCDGVDNDCDGVIDPGGNDDFDGDGISACDGDCNDYDPAVHPGATEVCDAQDNDCDGMCDNAANIDKDGDGFANCGDHGSFIDHEAGTCAYVPTPDCDDDNAEVHPGAPEICNGRDDNCNNECDEGLDPDGDGYTACGSKDPMIDPLPGECVDMELWLRDCAPQDGTVHPNAVELCDGVDTNCDGAFSNDISTCYEWGSSDAECRQGDMVCNESDGGEPWGSCSGSGELAPVARCGIWPYCNQTPNPAMCMSQSVNMTNSLQCHLHFQGSFSAGLCGGNSGRPTYYLPFGFSGNNNCKWHLLMPAGSSGYQEIGLIDPGNPGQPATDLLESCEAALVVLPNPNLSSNPGGITATLSFYYDNGAGDFYALEMPVNINPLTACSAGGENLTCVIN